MYRARHLSSEALAKEEALPLRAAHAFGGRGLFFIRGVVCFGGW